MLQPTSSTPVLSLLAAAVLALAAPHAGAGSFNITGASTSAQTLGAGQSGSIAASGTLTVSGSTVAVTVNGDNASLVNLGTLSQTGTGRAVRDNTGVTGLVVTNGSATNATALMKTADADVFQMNVAKGGVTLNNYGALLSLNASAGGAQAVDFNAITASGSPLAGSGQIHLTADHPEGYDRYSPMVSRLLHLLIIDILATTVALRIGEQLQPLLREMKNNLRSKRYT